MDDKPAIIMNSLYILFNRPAKNIGISQKKLLIQAIGEKLCPIKGILPSEENVDTCFLPFLQGIFISFAEQLNAFLPGQVLRNTCVAVKEMIGDYHA